MPAAKGSARTLLGPKTELDKATLKCFAVYSAHPPGFLAYWDKKYKNI
jgi:hypothetical protein